MQLSKKQIVFQNCFLHFWNVEKILNSSKKKTKKMTLIADVFRKLLIPKTMVR